MLWEIKLWKKWKHDHTETDTQIFKGLKGERTQTSVSKWLHEQTMTYTHNRRALVNTKVGIAHMGCNIDQPENIDLH